MSNTACKPIRIADAFGDSIVDGPGLRYVVFTQGCARGCPGCHNPQTHDYAGGRPVSAEELLERLDRNPLSRGVTLSGGEPFDQAGALLPFAEGVRARGLELAAYTGYVFEELAQMPDDVRALLALCDVLIDGPFVEAEKSLLLKFKGSRNQRVVDVQASLAAGKCVLSQDPRWI